MNEVDAMKLSWKIDHKSLDDSIDFTAYQMV